MHPALHIVIVSDVSLRRADDILGVYGPYESLSAALDVQAEISQKVPDFDVAVRRVDPPEAVESFIEAAGPDPEPEPDTSIVVCKNTMRLFIRAEDLHAGDVILGAFGAEATVKEVVKVGREYVYVKLDGLPKTRYERSHEMFVRR